MQVGIAVRRVLAMRRMMCGCLLMLLTLGGSCQASASAGFEDLVRVVKSGADEKALTEYVNSSPPAYALTVDEILYLSDLGLSAATIKAISAHGQNTSAEAPVEAAEAEPEPAGAESEPPGTEAAGETPVETPSAGSVVQEMPAAPPVTAAPPADAADYTTFYDVLAPYGNWFEIDGEWCWQPTALLVDSAWNPYCHRGRWVYSDCGWAWESSYSWGWAPFHYGRWRRHSRHGWIWRPGRTWGPAWVCWRYSGDAIGWAPLPPEVTWQTDIGLCYEGQAAPLAFDFGLSWADYTFVPVQRFCEPHVWLHRFPRSRREAVFRAASVVQNRVAFQEGRICNFGPPPDRITAITHQEIRPVRIVDQNILAGNPIPRPRNSGSTLAFYRPPVAPTARENPRQMVVRREALERERRDSIRQDEMFRFDRNASTVQGEQARGQESRGVLHTFAAPAASVSADLRRREQLRVTDEAARQRQAEEAAARQQEEQRRRAEDLIQRQNALRQQAQEQARQRALAEQQHREAEFARQREEQVRAEAAARQQESRRQMQEMTLQQERQREAEAAARAAAEQRQALRAQREAEEMAARRQEQEGLARRNAETVARQREAYRPPAALPGYGDASATRSESSRGANSRDYTRHARGRW